MIRFNSGVRYVKDFFVDKKFLILIFFIMDIIITYVFFLKVINSYHALDIKFSLADFILISVNPFLFYFNMIILPCVIMSIKIKNDFKFNSLIRHGNCIGLYVKQFFLICVIQPIIVLFQLIVTSFIGSCLSKSLINFNIRGSYFRFINQGHGTNISFVSVCVLTLLFCLLSSLAINTLCLLVTWFSNNTSLTLLFIVFISIMDIFTGSGICGWFGISHSQLLTYNLFTIMFILVLLFLFFIIGEFISLRKEFMSEK